MFGMAGGSAGQFLVGPMIAGGTSWKTFWIVAGIGGLLIAAVLFLLLPREQPVNQPTDWMKTTAAALGAVFRNPQSILYGLIGGLLFIPTTIFDMTWGVRYLQEGHGFGYGEAVMRSATVPLGWIIGCPLLGALSDRIGRRRPVIAMLPYTVIKEANPPELGGTATGVVSFLIFTFSALLGPVFARILENVSAREQVGLEHYQSTFQPLLYGVGLAIGLTFLLRETGAKVRAPLKVVKSL
jgi:predicted MFS family arabinose efflux permease